MKHNEVMIGDWVRFTDPDTDETELIRVATDDIGYDNEEFWQCFSPIEITPEILEANGFEKDPEDGTMCWENKEIEEVTWRGTILCISSISALMEHDSCMYVHQLQHALRLCGLDDLADNFKMTKGN